jgi:MFS family permease
MSKDEAGLPSSTSLAATLSELVAPHRRSSGVAIFNLGVTMFGGGIGPLAIGMFSDALTPSHGNEALRYALGATTGICFLLGALCFIWALKPYAAERQVPHALQAA